MSVSLKLENIGDTLSAGKYFGSIPGLLVGVPTASFIKPYITIPHGYYALVTSNGAMINDPVHGTCVWSSGVHFVPPWVKVSHLVTQGYTVFDTPCKGCKTKDNVTVQIDVDCVFRIMGGPGEDPNLVAKFVHEVTPRGLQQQLSDAMDEAVRVLARSMKHREVYGLRSVVTAVDDLEETNSPMIIDNGEFPNSPAKVVTTNKVTPGDIEFLEEKKEEAKEGIIDKLMVGAHDRTTVELQSKAVVKGESATARVIRALNKQFMPQGVQITDVMITNVELPHEIVQQMENKTMIISTNAQEIMTQQFEMQELKFSEELKKMAQAYEEERLQAHQDAAFQRNEASVTLENLKAQATKAVDLLIQENKVEIKSINANADYEVTKLDQDKNRIESDLRTKSLARAAEINADAELYCYQKLSEAKLEVERNNAKAIEILGEAEGKIAPLLEAFNEHAINIEKMSVFESLSNNNDLVLAPSGNSDMETLAVADHILSSANNSKQTSRSEMLSELMLMRAGGQVALNTTNGSAVLATTAK